MRFEKAILYLAILTLIEMPQCNSMIASVIMSTQRQKNIESMQGPESKFQKTLVALRSAYYSGHEVCNECTTPKKNDENCLACGSHLINSLGFKDDEGGLKRYSVPLEIMRHDRRSIDEILRFMACDAYYYKKDRNWRLVWTFNTAKKKCSSFLKEGRLNELEQAKTPEFRALGKELAEFYDKPETKKSGWIF